MTRRFCAIFTFLFLITSISFAQSVIPFNDKNISYQGRIPFTAEAAELIWPGTSLTINFEGTGVSGIFKDQDTSNYYNIIIDKHIIREIKFDTLKKSVVLAEGLPIGKHSLQVFKRTEWDKGTSWFYGLEMDKDTKLLQPSPRPKRKIEFFGNSITCAYGVEDPTGNSRVGYFENNYLSYAAITARYFNAQYHCTAKSGIGIMVSWAPLIMPEMYDRLNPNDPNSKWDFSRYTPDVVVINLFQNDSWIVLQPKNEQFKARFGSKAPDSAQIIAAYKNFVKTIRHTYPKATIICMLGNMDITREGSPWPGYVTAAVGELSDKKILTYFAPFKNTPGHPRVKEQQMLANGLIKFIQTNVKW